MEILCGSRKGAQLLREESSHVLFASTPLSSSYCELSVLLNIVESFVLNKARVIHACARTPFLTQLARRHAELLVPPLPLALPVHHLRQHPQLHRRVTPCISKPPADSLPLTPTAPRSTPPCAAATSLFGSLVCDTRNHRPQPHLTTTSKI